MTRLARICGGFCLFAVWACPFAWSEEAEPGTALPDDATIEAAGAVVGNITIHAGSIFDKDDPKENKKLFRAANKLHIETREHVIRRQLTFGEGDRYSRAALDESERLLRHNGYLYDASIRATSFDGHTVEIGVWTRDVWTLRPAAGFRRTGGVNMFHFGMHDANFLGFGKSVEVERVNGVDRTQTLALYNDPALGGTHTRLSLGYSNNSDGSSGLIGFERPFWRLDETWAAGVRGETNDRTDSLYALGEITDQFQEQRTYANVYFGHQFGASTRATRRLLVGYTFDRSLFAKIPLSEPATPLPPDRTIAYPWIGINLLATASSARTTWTRSAAPRT